MWGVLDGHLCEPSFIRGSHRSTSHPDRSDQSFDGPRDQIRWSCTCEPSQPPMRLDNTRSGAMDLLRGMEGKRGMTWTRSAEEREADGRRMGPTRERENTGEGEGNVSPLPIRIVRRTGWVRNGRRIDQPKQPHRRQQHTNVATAATGEDTSRLSEGGAKVQVPALLPSQENVAWRDKNRSWYALEISSVPMRSSQPIRILCGICFLPPSHAEGL